MPTDLDASFEADTPPSPQTLSDQRHARNELELVSLRATVVRLLDEIRSGAAPAGIEGSAAPATEAVDRPVANDACQSPSATAPQAEFLAMLAHELRNPLQSIAMANHLLTGADRSDQALAQIQGVLNRQIDHMARMLDDLLDASRVANGKILLQLQPVLLRDVINAAVESAQASVQRRQQTLQLNLPVADVTIPGDFVRLTQVFSNLLVNASKFSDTAGLISVAALCKDGQVEVSVGDNGAGIAAQLQPFVFDMFTQGPRTLDRVQGGLGIGLALVRSIVELHGGTAAVASPGAGAGSIFTITLPMAVAPAPPLPAPPPAMPATRSRNVLIIEDNRDANEMMGMLLEMEGHRVSSSFDGPDGLQRALDGQFDVVLCDLGLPGLTGFEVVAALKAARGQGAPFVIATTGYSDGAQRDPARAAGFDHYLVKPLDLPALYQVIASDAATRRA